MGLIRNLADDETGVSSLYKDQTVADSYIKKRFTYSWQLLLHQAQVLEINTVIRRIQPQSILEIAPGPARLTVDLEGVKQGVMLEYSKEMLKVARKRLTEKGLDRAWELVHGNAFELSKLPGCFDFVYTFRFIRHFRWHDRSRLYGGISERLKKGGLLMFDVVNSCTRDKLDEKTTPPREDALPVYDVTYTERGFRAEMDRYGFTVISMVPVLKHFKLQSRFSSKLDDVFPNLSAYLVHIFEKVPAIHPLEWIALCKKN